MRIYPATMLALCTLTVLFFSECCGAAWAQDAGVADATVAPASAIQITLPFNKAIVRESVPIKLKEFPDGGYVSVSIDDHFVTAQALPKSRTAPVYIWDTKASYTTPDQPDQPLTYADGTHAITISVFDAQNNFVGKDSVSVQLANKIAMSASQGIKLAYPWKTNLTLRYQRRTELDAIPTDGSNSKQALQQSLLRYVRTVENSTGGSFLIRDEIIPVDKTNHSPSFVSYVDTRGLTQALGNDFDIRAFYRVVDTRGDVLSTMGAQNGGNQIGFSIPVLPPRRVSIGAHWDTPVNMTLDWTSPNPTTVTATGTLEDFEWQDRYPTAKIRETYSGPANFVPGPGSVLPLIQAQDVRFERVIYFAYNAGRIVRMETTLTLTTTAPSVTPNSTAPGIAFPGTLTPQSFNSGSMLRRPGFGFPNSQGGASGTDGTPVTLKFTETSVILI